MEEPRFVTLEAFEVVGVEDDANKIDDVDPVFCELWMNRFMAHEPEVRPQSPDGVCYGVWFGAQGTDISNGRYLAGMGAIEPAIVPEGWVKRTIPAARYAVFDATLDLIGETTEQGLDVWLPASGYQYDGDKLRLDYMGPDTTGPESPVSVWIPVVPRTT